VKDEKGLAFSGVAAIVQARVGSTRFPNKVLQTFLGKPLIGHLIERLSRATSITRIVVAVPASSVNDELARICEEFGASVFRGSELDVLNRYAGAASTCEERVYLRITGDCPLVCPDLVDRVVGEFREKSLDYACTGRSFPDGLDVEVMSQAALLGANEGARESFDREHVTPFIKRNTPLDKRATLEHSSDFSRLRLTIDEPEDFDVISAVLGHFGTNEFGTVELFQLIADQPTLFVGNQHLVRDEGSMISTGQKLWRRAQRAIPGGSMLFSKRADLFSPQAWPSYFSRAKGCQVWDLDDRPFLDVGYMGIGTNLLGYGAPEVDEAVLRAIAKGNMSTLNAPEEVELAEKLCDLHGWADMVRFTRSGGEACSVAVRIARAASTRDGVAFCGYHGWHDWYLSSNLGDKTSLDQHLLVGLSPLGVPDQLKGLSRPFRYNDLEGLEEILRAGDTGVVFMEVQRNEVPQEGFLGGVRKLCSDYGAVLVFDECTSGFREVVGGLHLVRGVEPDILILGKTLGNGYAVNAVLGRREIMSHAESTFISSTFWTERIGSVAGLASLEEMERIQAPRIANEIGLEVRKGWYEIATSAGLAIKISGLPALSTYEIAGYKVAEAKTFIIERMLARGYLSPPAFYASVAHSPQVVSAYLENLADVFAELSGIEPDDLESLLSQGIARSSFGRLN
jgi:glutamate-1-semialdehyde 2,1-aminomutase